MQPRVIETLSQPQQNKLPTMILQLACALLLSTTLIVTLVGVEGLCIFLAGVASVLVALAYVAVVYSRNERERALAEQARHSS